MTQIYGSLLLLTAYFGTTLLTLLVSHDLGSYLFAQYCNAVTLPNDPCQAGALRVAAETFGAIALVVVVTIGFTQKSQRDGVPSPIIEPFETSRGLMLALLGAVTVVLVFHYVRHGATGYVGYTANESSFISMESLAWPLLLQLAFWSRGILAKGVLLGFLAAIVVISPFRNTLFSMFYFGALVPLGAMIAAKNALSRQKRVLALAAAVTLVLFAALVVVFQTNIRFHPRTPDEPSRITVIGKALTFRAITPFFGAVLLDQLVIVQEPLPSFVATIARKFHVTDVNLNEYAFKILYGSQNIAQETPLYYGESVANTRISPIFWQFAAPLALVLTYFALRPFCDLGVLIAVAIWRSSMGGLFDVVSALILQVGFCLVLSIFKSRSRGRFAIGARQ